MDCVPGTSSVKVNDADDNNKYDDYSSSDNDNDNHHCFCTENNVKTCMRNENISLGNIVISLKQNKTQ